MNFLVGNSLCKNFFKVLKSRKQLFNFSHFMVLPLPLARFCLELFALQGKLSVSRLLQKLKINLSRDSLSLEW